MCVGAFRFGRKLVERRIVEISEYVLLSAGTFDGKNLLPPCSYAKILALCN